jgi:hypothetical protein
MVVKIEFPNEISLGLWRSAVMTNAEREQRQRERSTRHRAEQQQPGERLGDMADIRHGPPLPGYEPVNDFWNQSMERFVNAPAPKPQRSRYEALERHGFRRLG